MRIEKLLFKNINSLLGKWEIDLTDPAYTSGGLFAIIGDTGSGKTTILDAICLALYGQTPRVAVTSNANDVMTRTTGECFAQVVFSNEKGRFLCHWEQNRAKGKAEGKLQNIQHWVAPVVDGQEGKPIGRTMSENKAKIIEITGMSFDEFTRSVMLAQGQFAAFLKAKPDERSPILEKITGTGIYTTISKAVHDRAMTEKRKLEGLEESVKAYPVMADEEVAALKAEEADNRQRETQLAQEDQQVSQWLVWYETMGKLQNDITVLTQQEESHQVKVARFAPKQVELDSAMKALGVDAAFIAFDDNRSQQKKLMQVLALLTGKQIPEKEAEKAKAHQAQAKVASELQKAKQDLEAARPLLREVRGVDQQIKEATEALQKAQQGAKTVKAKYDAGKDDVEQKGKALTEADKQIHRLDIWREKNRADEGLVSTFAMIENRFAGLVDLQKEMAENGKAIKAAHSVLDEALEKQSVAGKALSDCETALKSADGALAVTDEKLAAVLDGQTIEGLRLNRDALIEKRHQQELVASLENQRAKLKPGEPCPCCGSTVHPFVEVGFAVSDTLESDIKALETQIKKAEKLENARQKALAVINSAKADLAEADSGKKFSDEKVRHAKKEVDRLVDDEAALLTRYQAEGERVLENIVPFGYQALPQDAKGCVESLGKRLEAWQKKNTEFTEAVGARDALASEIKVLEAGLKAQGAFLAEKEAVVLDVQNQLKGLKDARFAKFAEKNPDVEETRFTQAIQRLEKAVEAKQEAYLASDRELAGLLSLQGSQQEELEEAKRVATAVAATFREALERSAFADEAAYCAARRSQDQIDQLTAMSTKIREEGVQIQAKLQANRQKLETERNRQLTDIPQPELDERHRAFAVQKRDLAKRLGEIGEKLSQDQANRNQRKEIQGKIDAQAKVYGDWDSLRNLIGHHDGKEFRNFVQSLTFEFVIAHANDQLQKMDGRYLLKASADNGLDLMVVDSWQGGTVRTIKNLSGGESFIVSLALALGLSEMTGRSDRIDSLFLDEGFGTLDEETLVTAMDTLSDLNRSGRLIGIISHVEALKERIATQIQVIKRLDGTSRLEGPGCRKLA